MKITVASDVHGNLPALEIMLKEEADADKFIFLGDAVNYAPWSNECVELLSSLKNTILLKGNHEEYFIEGTYLGTNSIARQFFNVCFPRFKRSQLIRRFADTYQQDDFTFVHTILDRYIYPDTHLDLDKNLMIGHSHHQFLTESNGFKLYNPGSVGQNRKFINLISYLNWFPLEKRFDFVNLPYDERIVISEMRKEMYPQPCIDYYLAKKRA